MTEAAIAQSYKRARVLAILLGASAVVLVATVAMLISNAVSRLMGTPGARTFGGIDVEKAGTAVAVVSALVLTASAIGTTAAILRGWRADRRQSDDLKLKVRELERQLAETRARDALG